MRLRTGDVAGGMGLLGEAMAGAVAGELGPFATAEVVCEMVVACLDLTEYERAGEWLEIAGRAGRQLVCFPGCCRTHRATVLRHQGEWPEAQRQAHQARAEVAGIEALHEGMALTEIGELYRCTGELALAEKAFSEAYEKGWQPQPGLALLVLANGDVSDAATMIQQSVERSAAEPAALVRLLPVQVEIAIAGDDVETAAASADRLAEVTTGLGTNAAVGANACVAGLLLQAGGDLAGAAAQFEHSIRSWQRADSPYEVAQARMHLASVRLSMADVGSAKRELAAALTTFERLGATPEVRDAARRLGRDAPRRSTCTFMFTDIVNSTILLTTIGDDAWHRVRQWHDRVLSDVVTEHLGRVVKETGDGFFVAFDDPALAVAGAVAIQQALAEHRRTDGFSPAVRIGLHTGSAVATDNDYAGRDVVVAARIAALAGADEILISADLADRLGSNVRVLPRVATTLKGIPEPVEVARVEWC
jgi:class 3 adenylate cyclase